MKAAFIFDTFLLKKEQNFYGITLTYDFFENRYLDIFDTLVISTRYKNMNEEHGNVDGYRIANGKNVLICPINNYKDILDSITNYKKIIKEMENVVNSVDKLIIRMPSILGCFACECAEKLKKPYLIEMVACPWDNYMNHARFGGKMLAIIMTFLIKKYVKKAPNVLYVTNNFLQKRYPTSGKSVGCSDVVLCDNNEVYFEKRINMINCYKEEKTFKIVTVGSVQLKYKGQKYVLKALKELKKENIDLVYYLIGGGDNSRLKKLVEKYNLNKNVVFVGSISHNEILERISVMDLYIQPSLQEGLPRALVEAMSIGIPAIGSNAGGIPELLDKDMIFKKKKHKKIVELIKSMNNEKLLEQAHKNYYLAKKYINSELMPIRNKFYREI